MDYYKVYEEKCMILKLMLKRPFPAYESIRKVKFEVKIYSLQQYFYNNCSFGLKLSTFLSREPHRHGPSMLFATYFPPEMKFYCKLIYQCIVEVASAPCLSSQSPSMSLPADIIYCDLKDIT